MMAFLSYICQESRRGRNFFPFYCHFEVPWDSLKDTQVTWRWTNWHQLLDCGSITPHKWSLDNPVTLVLSISILSSFIALHFVGQIQTGISLAAFIEVFLFESCHVQVSSSINALKFPSIICPPKCNKMKKEEIEIDRSPINLEEWSSVESMENTNRRSLASFSPICSVWAHPLLSI